MDGFAADHGGYRSTIGPDRHRLANQLLWIPAADRLRVQETIVVNVGDQHSDLVAVTRVHQTWTFWVTNRRDQVAVDVGGDVVGKRRDVIADDGLDLFLVSGGAGCCDGVAKEAKCRIVHGDA